MSNKYRNRSFIGGGKLYLRQRSDTGVLPAYPMGNADSFSFAIGEDKKTQRNYQTPGGGNIASQSAITDVTATINALSLQPETLAVALRSLVASVAAGAVTDEPVKVFKEAFTPLAKFPDTAQTITVKNTAGTTTYVEGTDYVIERGGVFIPEGSAITTADTTNAGVDVEVTYTGVASFNIEAITQASVEYELIFDGFNDADNGKPVRVTCHRIKFSPTQALELISEDFGALPINLEILADDSKVGAGVSQYFKVEMVA